IDHVIVVAVDDHAAMITCGQNKGDRTGWKGHGWKVSATAPAQAISLRYAPPKGAIGAEFNAVRGYVGRRERASPPGRAAGPRGSASRRNRLRRALSRGSRPPPRRSER